MREYLHVVLLAKILSLCELKATENTMRQY
jgi:hypothetical protein